MLGRESEHLACSPVLLSRHVNGVLAGSSVGRGSREVKGGVSLTSCTGLCKGKRVSVEATELIPQNFKLSAALPVSCLEGRGATELAEGRCLASTSSQGEISFV